VLNVIFFRTEAGKEPVLDWLRAFAIEDRRILGEDLRTVQLGWPLGMPLCRPLGAGLYEVRSHLTGGQIARLVFFQSEQNLIVVEGFIKRTPTTPKQVLDLARKRRGAYERNLAAQSSGPKS
jgi:phage-related protein